jgi:hypothetical protein
MKTNKLIVVLTLIILGVVCRLLPHAWNFTPIAAMAIFAGTYLGKKEAVIIPIVSMLIGDLFIGFYAWQIMIPVYFSLVFAGVIGTIIKKHKSFETVLAGSIMASVLFFLITNFAVWLFSPLYAHSVAGLLECYAMALPFFRNTLLGDLFYVGTLFGAYEAVLYFYRSNEKVFVKQVVD